MPEWWRTLKIENLPQSLATGNWRPSTIDLDHGNIFGNPSHCELEWTASEPVEDSAFAIDRTLLPNAVVLLELVGN